MRAFNDESLNDRIFCISGYLAPASVWGEFEIKWKRALKEERLPYFHMADCEAREEEFKGISKLERARLQRKFIEIITSTQATAIAVGVHLKFYDALADRIKKRGIKYSKAYFTAFVHQVDHLASRIAHLPPEEQIGFVFDRQNEYQGRAKELYDSLLGHPELPFHSRLGPLGFADKTKVVPLQAADILAYESFRYLRDVTWNYRNKSPRWQWAALSARNYIDLRGLDDKSIEELSKALETKSGLV